VRAVARLYATGGNAAIYYGLGVTEHSQGSTTVMGIANLALATGNLGREGVGVNPLRGQNNVQGSCDMGSFPHEFPGYRHVADSATRILFEAAWGVHLDAEPGLRIPNMFEAALDGSFRALYVQGEDIAQSDPDTQHVTAALEAMECIIVQDLFLNERRSSPTCSCPDRPSSRRTAPSPMPSVASRACARSCRRWEARPTGKRRWPCRRRSVTRCTTGTIRRKSWTRSRR
jgi:predicted molibdopterin-dependent oxidoreductase YjgC